MHSQHFLEVATVPYVVSLILVSYSAIRHSFCGIDVEASIGSTNKKKKPLPRAFDQILNIHSSIVATLMSYHAFTILEESKLAKRHPRFEAMLYGEVERGVFATRTRRRVPLLRRLFDLIINCCRWKKYDTYVSRGVHFGCIKKLRRMDTLTQVTYFSL